MNARSALDRTILLTQTLGSASADDVLTALLGQRVVISAELSVAESVSGQTAIAALATQLFAIGATLELEFENSALVLPQPPLRGLRIRSAVEDLSRDHITGLTGPRAFVSPPFVIALGNAQRINSGHGCRIGFDDNTASIAALHERVQPPAGCLPFGPMAAACLATAEVYKCAVRRLFDRLGLVIPDELKITSATTFRFASPAQRPKERADLGDIDFISGGAITTAALFALCRVPGLAGRVRVIEPDSLDLSNLNRYLLMRLCDLGLRKVDLLSQYSSSAFQITGLPLRFDGSTRKQLMPFAPTILVGADDLQPRWDAQDLRPKWLGIGATANFFVQVSEHSATESGCGRCAHPYDDGVRATTPTVSFVSAWAGALLAVRTLRYGMTGTMSHAQDRMSELWPLRVDGRRAYVNRRIAASAECPAHTPAL